MKEKTKFICFVGRIANSSPIALLRITCIGLIFKHDVHHFVKFAYKVTHGKNACSFTRKNVIGLPFH